MKYRTLLFGAGQGSLKLALNLSSDYEFLGYIDNDLNKVGTSFGGLPVYGPKALGSLNFDKIMISTQWALPVKRQLIDDLGISPDKIILPEKKVFKTAEPFMNSASLTLGRKIILELNRLANEQGVPLVIDFGTLLGIARDSDIISWDDDIDFSAPIEYAQQVEDILTTFCAGSREKVEWRISRLEGANHKVAGLCLDFVDPTEEITNFTTSLCFRSINNGNAEHLPSLGMWYAPEHHFRNVGQIEWLGNVLQVPSEHLDYLTFLYGDWQIPKKDIQLSDYAHLNDVEYADIEEAKFSSLNVSFSKFDESSF